MFHSAAGNRSAMRAIPFVAGFLEAGDDPAAEAAFALAEIRNPAALAVLLARQKDSADPWFAGVLLSAIALTRLPEAIDFLLADDRARRTRSAGGDRGPEPGGQWRGIAGAPGACGGGNGERAA